MNPWRLSPREAQTLDCLLKHGHLKGAAREMDLSQRTVEAHVAAVLRKMGVRHKLLAAVTWDRFNRATEGQKWQNASNSNPHGSSAF